MERGKVKTMPKNIKQRKEKRKTKRAPIEIDIDLSTYGTYQINKLTNVSMGGAFICTEKLQPVGTEMKMRFQLPDDEAVIEARGQVMWAYTQPKGSSKPNSTGMGVKFTKIRKTDQERIQEFVESIKS